MNQTKQEKIEELEEQVDYFQEQARTAAMHNAQLANAVKDRDAILSRLHAVAKHGSVRSGAWKYIRAELIEIFNEEPEKKA